MSRQDGQWDASTELDSAQAVDAQAEATFTRALQNNRPLLTGPALLGV